MASKANQKVHAWKNENETGHHGGKERGMREHSHRNTCALRIYHFLSVPSTLVLFAILVSSFLIFLRFSSKIGLPKKKDRLDVRKFSATLPHSREDVCFLSDSVHLSDMFLTVNLIVFWLWEWNAEWHCYLQVRKNCSICIFPILKKYQFYFSIYLSTERNRTDFL